MAISEQVEEALIRTRKALHAHPELSGDEKSTAETIALAVKKQKPTSIVEGIGGHGVMAVFDSGSPGASLMFRAEMDALPIMEKNDFDHKSKVSTVSHKCGHDGHMTILLGLARSLRSEPPKHGKVLLLFQPSEENGAGAKQVLDDDVLGKWHPDFAFALHNLPGYPLGSVVVRQDIFTASVQSLIIRLQGAETHAAQPELGKNPALAIAAILQHADALSNNDPDREDFALVTPVYITMGKKAYGISAGDGEVHLTLRTWTAQQMEELADAVVARTTEVADKYQLKLDLEWTNVFHANKNDEEAVQHITAAAEELGIAIVTKDSPFKWGEDFGIFTQKFKGAMFGLGSGEDSHPLHHAEYDFPDALIPVGVQMFRTIINRILQ